MIGQDIIDQLSAQIKSIMQNNPLSDIEGNIKTLLTSGLSKLNIVTREEFDTQQKVLIATRKKLDELEQKIEQLLSK